VQTDVCPTCIHRLADWADKHGKALHDASDESRPPSRYTHGRMQPPGTVRGPL
jgi:hypothetical protein